MIAPDFLTLALVFAVFLTIALAAAFENRAMLRLSPTISELTHRHVFAVVMLGGWICIGIGMLVGHFMSGPIYCGG